MKNNKKVLVILGATASGKTSLGVKLAFDYNGEIISADSRQVYKGMDIGSGKDLEEFYYNNKKIKYHLIDIVNPMDDFHIAKYQKLAYKAIDGVLKIDKLPIIVGGSGLYLQAVIDNYQLGNISTNIKRRNELEKLPIEDLFNRIKILKADFANHLNNSEKNNPRRLARYLEILEGGEEINKKGKSLYNFLIIGIDFPDEILRSRIEYRLLKRFEEGMIVEVKNLMNNGVSTEKLKSFGLEYRYITEYLEEKFDYQEMVNKLSTAIYRFAKRQKTWFKRLEKQGHKIYWIKDDNEAKKLIDDFLKKTA